MADEPDKIERTWIFDGGQPAFDFDAVVRESHESEISITENPIEGGSPAHDHAVILPKRYEMEGRVSDSPMPSGGAAVFGTEGRRSVTAFEMLIGLQESREVFTVLTGLKRYTNMMLKKITTVQDAGTAEVLDFTAQLQQVRIVNTEIVTFPPRRPGKTKKQGDKKTEGGEKKAEAPKPVDRASLLTKLKDYMSGGEVDLGSVLP